MEGTSFLPSLGVLGFLVLLLDAQLPLGVDFKFWRLERRHLRELEDRVLEQLSGKPKERLLDVVVRLRGDVVVLKDEKKSQLLPPTPISNYGPKY